jgi:hypothetical protein
VIERANAADTSVYVVTMPSYTRVLASTQMVPLADAFRCEWAG